MDEQIYTRLQEKEQCMLTAIENDTLEVMPTPEEELELIFKQVGFWWDGASWLGDIIPSTKKKAKRLLRTEPQKSVRAK